MLGTALAAAGYRLAGLPGGIFGLYAALALSGLGSSTQHPIASAAVSRAYAGNALGPFSAYNFSGDIGKAAIPAAVSLLLTVLPWRTALLSLALAELAVAALLTLGLPEKTKLSHRSMNDIPN